ncbi:hypothetical protein V8E55_006272 [Tylopilus felleus]
MFGSGRDELYVGLLATNVCLRRRGLEKATSLEVNQCIPPRSKFNASDIPDLTGKVVIVTGANTATAMDEFNTTTGKETVFFKLDLGNLKSVKTAAEERLSKETRLDVLNNNAGVMLPPVSRFLTERGYSKGNAVLASELDRRYRAEEICLGFYDTTHGVLTQLYAAISPAATDLGGKYLVPWARIRPSRQDAHSSQLGQEL